LRPPDPNRNRVLDIYSEGTEGDADYMRMVQDVSHLFRSFPCSLMHLQSIRIINIMIVYNYKIAYRSSRVVLFIMQIEDAQQSQVGWLFGRGGGRLVLLALFLARSTHCYQHHAVLRSWCPACSF
jgi:hypothetical protein